MNSIIQEIIGTHEYGTVIAGVVWGFLGILIITAYTKKSISDIVDSPKDRLHLFMQFLLLLIGLRFCNFIIGNETVTSWSGFLIGISTERIYSFILNYKKENIKE